MAKYIENAITQNRTEELGYDLWEDFVIPPYFDSLDLLGARKPRVILGGRGCGKTMLLRYLCHETQFSQQRENIGKSDLQQIGLYWRIDTQFAKMLTQRNVEEEEWLSAFEHMAILLTSREVLKSLDSIAKSKFPDFSDTDLARFDFSILSSFNIAVPNNYDELKMFLRKEFNHFQVWAGNIKKVEPPIFLVKGFLVELINEIKSQCSLFANTNYFVYIDEYENLLSYQQRLINTWLKHSEMPVIFNLAMKRNSFYERKTIGSEQLVDIHDYRVYDLESYYENVVQYDLFAAEILFLRLHKSGYEKVPISPVELRSSNQEIINKRRSGAYRERVISYAKIFLPSESQLDLAKGVFADTILQKRLRAVLNDIIEKRKLNNKVEDFIFEEIPEASIIIPALLARGVDVDIITKELRNLLNNKENKFTGKTDWIKNNFIGCLLLLYEPLGRYCPFYAGFDAFCQMSNNNLRHFLELCNKSIVNESLTSHKQITAIECIHVKNQAEAAKQASAGFLKEIKSFGTRGNLIYRFVLRLGTYFHWAHKRPSQSEPELNQFSIKETSDVSILELLNECVKWSVLYQRPITKQKAGNKNLREEYFEYILNPIYSPYFHISYRKKRRVEFSESEITTFLIGDVVQFEMMMNLVIKRWKIHNSDNTVDLFSTND